MSTIPAGMPVLHRGRHRHPSQGACLMEATALLTGQPLTDHPVGVHPLIAAVARIVNDAVSDPARQQLLRFAPAAAGSATDDPRVVDELVVLVCGRALPVVLPIWAPAIRRALRDAHRRHGQNRQSLTRWQLRRAEAAVRYATVSLVLAGRTNRDQQLTALLADCLTTVQRTVASNVPAVAPGPRRGGNEEGQTRAHRRSI
jgi:hypothetical protein